MFKHLYTGEIIDFDLTNNLTKIVRKNNRGHTVSNVTTFTREAKFVRDEDDIH